MSESNKERYTFFLDIDGLLLFKDDNHSKTKFSSKIPILPGVEEFFHLCGMKGHRVILTSGRKESLRAITEQQLFNAGIEYDMLILGISNAIRVIANDTKPYRTDNPPTCLAFNIDRNKGIQELVDLIK
jgi:hypothetical protein